MLKLFEVFQKPLARWQSIVLVRLLMSLNKLYIFFQCFNCRFRQVNIRCSIGIFSRPTSSRNHNAADETIVMEILICFFSGKQQGSIRTDQKNYSLFLYHFCMVVTIFKEATSLSISSTTWPSLAQGRKQMKTIYFFST